MKSKKKSESQPKPVPHEPHIPETSQLPQTISGRYVSAIFLLVIMIVALFLAYKVIQPYVNTLILAILLSSVWFPLHNRLVRLLKGKVAIAAILSCILIVLLIILPLTALSVSLVQQGIASVKSVQLWIQHGGLEKILNLPLVERIKTFASEKLDITTLQSLNLNSQLLNGSKNVGQFLLNHGSALIQNLSSITMKFFLLIFIVFYMLKDGPRMKQHLLHLLPLKQSQEDQLIARIRSVSKSVLWGSMLTAVAQGIAGGIGLLIVGIPALFWGAMMGFTSFIPVVGTTLIWIPSCVYLLIIGSWGKAIFLAIWCVTVVGSIDNFLRPMLMGGQTGMSSFLLFFAILGGISYFGFIGIIYGPLVFGLLAVLLYIYELEYADFLQKQDQS